MDAILYTATAILLYLFADWLLRRLEERAGRVFEHRTLFFFAILLALALVSFWGIRQILQAA